MGQINDIEYVNIDFILASQDTCTIDKLRDIKTLPWLSIVCSIKGSYSISLDGGEFYITEEGGCFIAPAGVKQDIIHNTAKNGEAMKMKWVFLDVKIDDIYKLDDIYNFPIILTPEKSKNISIIISKLLKITKNNNLSDVLEKNILGFELAKILVGFGSEKKVFDDSILPAIRTIRSYYYKKLTLKQLADNCSLSVSSFIQCFKKATRQTPITYINNYRLSVAASLLLTTSISIQQISEQIGFCDQFYFSKCFNKKYSLSPLTYRKLKQNYTNLP